MLLLLFPSTVADQLSSCHSDCIVCHHHPTADSAFLRYVSSFFIAIMITLAKVKNKYNIIEKKIPAKASDTYVLCFYKIEKLSHTFSFTSSVQTKHHLKGVLLLVRSH